MTLKKFKIKLAEVLRTKVETDEYSMIQLQQLLEGLEAVRKDDLTAQLLKDKRHMQ